MSRGWTFSRKLPGAQKAGKYDPQGEEKSVN